MNLLKTTLIIFSESLFSLRKKFGRFLGLFLLSIMFIVVFEVAYEPSPKDLVNFLPGLIWVTSILSSSIGILKIWDDEENESLLDFLKSSSLDRGGIVLGKSLWGAFLCFLITIATLLMTFFFFDYSLTIEQVVFLLIVIIFSSIAFGFLGGIFGALSLGLNFRNILLPLFLYPLAVPILMSSINITKDIIADGLLVGNWFYILFVYSFVQFLLVFGLGEKALDS
ncbi:hypothetical protein CL643_03840 [bacterium]|nr:hypothetical protein [bacterium]|tara:strand:- start:4434 stop:5108 length:675 start_codon:yes stop_codon:yes gene_type:complete